MRLLRAIYSVHPSEGGTVEAARQFSRALADLGHEVEVVSLDPPDADYLDDFPAPVRALGSNGTRFGFSPALIPWLKSHQREYDAVIIDGLWQYNSFGVWRALRKSNTPYYVYPHGMLDSWSSERYTLKRLKKRLYWPWGGYPILRDARAVIFTCDEEKRQARESFPLRRINERVVPLGISPPDGDPIRQKRAFLEAFPQPDRGTILLYMGRIHLKKGVDLLIDAFGHAARKHPRLHLVIAGPGDPKLVDALRKRLESLSPSAASRATWTGMLEGDLKWGAFRVADAFLMPSHQDSFGLAAVEAMACGVPALVSDRVNIWREIAEDGAGFAERDDLEGTVRCIEKWTELPEDGKRKTRERAIESFRRRYDIRRAASLLVSELQALNPPGPNG